MASDMHSFMGIVVCTCCSLQQLDRPHPKWSVSLPVDESLIRCFGPTQEVDETRRSKAMREIERRPLR